MTCLGLLPAKALVVLRLKANKRQPFGLLHGSKMWFIIPLING